MYALSDAVAAQMVRELLRLSPAELEALVVAPPAADGPADMLRLLLPRACAWLRACPLVADADAAADGPSSLAAVGRLLSTMSGKALAAGIKEQDQLALHRCFLFLLRSSLRTPLMEQLLRPSTAARRPTSARRRRRWRCSPQMLTRRSDDRRRRRRRRRRRAAGGRRRWRWRCRSGRARRRPSCAAPRERGRRGTWSARRRRRRRRRRQRHCGGRCARPW